jgi:hypothetical protein
MEMIINACGIFINIISIKGKILAFFTLFILLSFNNFLMNMVIATPQQHIFTTRNNVIFIQMLHEVVLMRIVQTFLEEPKTDKFYP